MNGEPVITVQQLIAVLASLPAAAKVFPNLLGNLTVLSEDGVYRGFIDFNTGLFEEPGRG